MTTSSRAPGVVTELDRAINDVRRDIIDEIASAMPGAPAREVVAAIVRRLGCGLPALVEVEIEVSRPSH